MRKVLFVILAVLLTVGLAACGNTEKDEGKNDNSKTEENQDTNDNAQDNKDNTNDEGKVKESELGKLTVVKQKKDLNQTVKSGPMNITFNAVQAATLEPSEDYKDLFDGKEKLTIITIDMKVENTSDDTISMYPNQATLTTNTGEQVDANLFLSNDVGGDFFGKIKKEGNVIFQLDTPAKEITNVKYIVDGAHDAEFNSLSDQLQIDFNF